MPHPIAVAQVPVVVAQVEPLTQQVVGMLAIGLLVFLGALSLVLLIGTQIRSLFFATPTPTAKNAPITQGDLDAAVKQIDLRFDQLVKTETVTALSARFLSLEQRHDRLDRYTHTSMHELRNALQNLVLDVHTIGTKLGAAMPRHRIEPMEGDCDGDPMEP